MTIARGTLAALVGVVIAQATTPLVLEGTQIDPTLDFATTVRDAQLIFAGTVSRSWVEMHPSGYFPLTRVVFRRLKFAKPATVRDSLVVSFWGGQVGTLLYRISEQPKFEIGGRYILMMAADLGSERNGYSPVVGMNRGCFSVTMGSLGRPGSVQDWSGRPIARVERNHLVVVEPAPPGSANREKPPSDGGPNMGSQMLRAGIEHEPVLVVLRPTNDPGTRVSEEEFFRTVETMIANEAR